MVKFLRQNGIYQPGDVAGLPPEIEARYICHGVAARIDETGRVTKPAAVLSSQPDMVTKGECNGPDCGRTRVTSREKARKSRKG
jgi:hypothetical protein